ARRPTPVVEPPGDRSATPLLALATAVVTRKALQERRLQGEALCGREWDCEEINSSCLDDLTVMELIAALWQRPEQRSRSASSRMAGRSVLCCPTPSSRRGSDTSSRIQLFTSRAPPSARCATRRPAARPSEFRHA